MEKVSYSRATLRATRWIVLAVLVLSWQGGPLQARPGVAQGNPLLKELKEITDYLKVLRLNQENLANGWIVVGNMIYPPDEYPTAHGARGKQRQHEFIAPEPPSEKHGVAALPRFLFGGRAFWAAYWSPFRAAYP